MKQALHLFLCAVVILIWSLEKLIKSGSVFANANTNMADCLHFCEQIIFLENF